MNDDKTKLTDNSINGNKGNNSGKKNSSNSNKNKVKKNNNTNNKNSKNNVSKKNDNNKGEKKQSQDLEKTGVVDLVFDDERLEKTELLDVSFIKEEKKKKDSASEKIEILELEDYNLTEDKKKNPLLMFLIVLVAFVLGFISNTLFIKDEVQTKIKIKKEEVVRNDENIVFVGDSIFEGYDIDKYFKGKHVVNSGVSGNTTISILEDMEKRIYRYNPSEVFLLIGTNDFTHDDISREDTVVNIGEIIDKIKENRAYTKINVLSILPINDSNDEKINIEMIGRRNNKDIKKMNSSIEILCEEKGSTFIDVYSLLVDEDDKLKIDYTREGLHLTSDGYSAITKEISKYLEK